MFRPIGSALDKKKNSLNTQKDRQTIVREVVLGHAKEAFGNTEQISRWTISYDPQQQQVSIETGSKVFASELLLRAGELGALLRQRGVGLRRLVVR